MPRGNQGRINWETGIDIYVKVKVDQLCLTLCDTIDYTAHGILQTRILEWVAFPFFRGQSLMKRATGF